MKILITGIPGTGKSFLSNKIKDKFKNYKFLVVNDKIFSKRYKLGEYNKSEKTYEVDIPSLNKKLESYLKTNRNLILEGHLFSEISKNNLLKFDKIVVLTSSEKILRKRYKKRNYATIKIEDNIFCSNTNYIENVLNKKNIDFKQIKLTENTNSNIKQLVSYLKL